MRRLLGVAGAILILSTQASPALTFSTGLPFGPHAVGFHREWILDPTRIWEEALASGEAHNARPVRVDVWYPTSAAGACRPATLLDYLHTRAPDAYFGVANAYIEKWDEASLRGLAKSSNRPFDDIMALTGRACLNAAPPATKFPLVLYSGGWYNRSPDNAALAEYLASSGYVFAAVPLFGAGLWTGDLRSTAAALETQMRDVEVALNELIDHPWVDREHVAIVGYSSGGIVALLVAGHHPLIDAVVGLDPSYMGEPAKVLESGFFNAEGFRLPLLTLRSGNLVFTARDRSALVNILTSADRYTADVGSGSHGDFGDDVVIEKALGLVRAGEPRTTEDGIAAYRAVVVAVRQLLDGTLKDQPQALEALAASSGVLRMTVTRAMK